MLIAMFFCFFFCWSFKIAFKSFNLLLLDEKQKKRIIYQVSKLEPRREGGFLTDVMFWSALFSEKVRRMMK